MDELTELIERGGEPGIGHNRASDLDLLREAIDEIIAPLHARLAMLQEGIARAPADIANRPTAENVADALRMVMALRQAIEEARKTAKAPHLAAARLIDNLFAPIADDTRALEAELSPRLTAWLQAQPRRDNGKTRVRTALGAVASLGDGEKIIVESREAVDLESLRPFLEFEAIAKAARAYVAQHKGAPAGVRVEPVRRLVIR